MCLLPEWNAFQTGFICGAAGALILLIQSVVAWIRSGRRIRINWKLTGKVLFGILGALLRRARIASSRKLEVGSFTMDMDEHTALLGDEEINLTNREFNILYKLLSYPKKTFTRQQLMDEFWARIRTPLPERWMCT